MDSSCWPTTGAQHGDELAVTRRAAELLKEAAPFRRFAAIQVMAAQGFPVQLCCRVLEVSQSGFYAWRTRPSPARAIRHAWLTDAIRQVHTASRQTYGRRRVHAELTLSRGISVGYHAVELLMHRAGLQGVTGRPKFRRGLRPEATADDLVNRQFARAGPDRLWVADIVRHEAPWIRVEVRDHHRRPVAAGRLKLRAA